jgi:hypothetical protein
MWYPTFGKERQRWGTRQSEVFDKFEEIAMTKIFSLVLSLGLLAATAVASQKMETAEETLANFEKDFAQSQITKDAKLFARIEATMSDDFYWFDLTNGSRSNKVDILEGIKSPDYVVTAMNFPPFSIHIFGSTALVQGTNDAAGSYKGKAWSGTYVWFDVFEKQDGRWVWLVSQGSKVDEKVTNKVLCDKPFCATNQPGFSLKAGSAQVAR